MVKWAWKERVIRFLIENKGGHSIRQVQSGVNIQKLQDEIYSEYKLQEVKK